MHWGWGYGGVPLPRTPVIKNYTPVLFLMLCNYFSLIVGGGHIFKYFEGTGVLFIFAEKPAWICSMKVIMNT